MVFKSVEDIKNDILNKMQISVLNTQQNVYDIINNVVKQFYAEYSPKVYETTGQLYRSLVRSEIIRTSNGWVASVYFDASKLDYGRKRITKVKTARGYMNVYNHTYSTNGWFDNTGYSDEIILQTTMESRKPHGGYAGGTAIWKTSSKIFKSKLLKTIKSELRKSGIPVK